MSVSIGMYVATVLAVATVSPAYATSNDEFDWLWRLKMQHCDIGTPPPHGDVPIRIWRREMQICKEYGLKIDKIMWRCKSGLSENNYACSRLLAGRPVIRFPPPDPRKRK
jgi:hypothetical protein